MLFALKSGLLYENSQTTNRSFKSNKIMTLQKWKTATLNTVKIR